MNHRVLRVVALPFSLVVGLTMPLSSQTPAVQFNQSAAEVDTFDFVEVTAAVSGSLPGNPFTEASVVGELQAEEGPSLRIDGFCDSPAGSVQRIRFLPTRAGKHTYSVVYRQGAFEARSSGAFAARDRGRKGIVKVDREYPWHFVWSGTGDHFLWNATTTYSILGWDDATMLGIVDRLASLRVNRIRAVLCGRVKDGHDWNEDVLPSEKFTFLLCPWVVERPADIANPGIDVSRFNVEHWRKYERLLRRAREKDVVMSVIFYVDGRKPGVDPFGKQGMGGPDEERYYRYAAARLGSFSNVMWDVTNEYRLFRDDAWAEKMGAFLKRCDPYGHAMSVHGHEDFHFRASPWADFAMYQSWDEHGGHEFMLKNRKLQAELGRPIPQVIEEYGYEDHYPVGWGENRRPPARSADNRRRLAWGMHMAGGYQTTGERATRGGGWINGLADDETGLLRLHGHIVEFFDAFAWWRAEPRDDIVSSGNMCLAEPGSTYAVYLPAGGSVTVAIGAGAYRAEWFDPRAGRWSSAGLVTGPSWTANAPGSDDWALLLRRAAGGGSATPTRQPIELHPENPRYFLFRGQPAVLVTSGEHYGAVLNLDFDYVPYLDELQRRGFNLTRTFSGAYREIPGSFGITGNTLAPLKGRYLAPWPRSSEPGYFDGTSKFDLTKWDEAYFRRLRDFLANASVRGIVVEYVLFCPMYDEALWKANPMNSANNRNGVGNVPLNEVYTLKHGDLLEVQSAFARKAVTELNDLDNVYFEICNEPYFGGVTLEWQRHIAQVIIDTEATLPRKHLIAQNIANRTARVDGVHPAVSIFNFHYAAPPDAVQDNWSLRRPIAFDESGFRGSEDTPYRTEAWEFLVAGGALYSNLDYSFSPSKESGPARMNAPGGGGPALRGELATLKRFIDGFDFLRMAPDPEVIRDGVPGSLRGRALSQPGRAYALYFHNQSSGGPFSIRWTGQVVPRFSETYSFHTISNDGVRLWIAGNLLVDNWTDHAGREDSGTIALEAGKSAEIKLEYYQNGGSAAARLLWSSPSQKREVIAGDRLRLPGGAGNGLQGDYFADKDLKERKLTRTDPKVDFEWVNESPLERAASTEPFALQLELPAGSYSAEWMDPVTGGVAARESFEHPGGSRTLRSPAMKEDLALRILAR